jgi:cell cycle sensor histidine kinase DivJ
LLKRLSATLSQLRIRLVDALRGGAVFAGGGETCVVLIDSGGRLVDASGPLAGLFADAPKALSLPDLFLPDERAAVDRAVRSKAVSRVEARGRRKDGVAGSFELTFQRRSDGRTAVLIIDRSDDERDSARLSREIERARANARDGADMLADLSHEMRTPLNAVIGFAETIERQTFGPIGHENYAQYAEHIRASGRHLLDLVNSVIDLAKIDAERFTLNRTKVDPAALARECAGIMRHAIEDAGLTLDLDIAGDLPESWLDAQAVRQILLNLLSNAVKFTSDGAVRLSARCDGGELVFVISDDGVGMSAENLARIGERFTAAQGAGVRGQGGAGIGLSLAMSLAELHGGGLSLASAPGEGLKAEVRLPVAAAQVPAKGAVRAQLAKARAADRAATASGETVLTQLERIEAYRREVARKRAPGAAKAADAA